MFGRGLQILAHRQEIDIGRPHIVHHLMHFQPLFAQPQHDARLGKDRRIEPLDRLQQPQRRIITRAGPDGRIETRNRLQIMVINVRPRRDDHLDRPLMLVAEVRGQYLDRRVGRRPAQRLDHLDELRRPAIGQIIAIDRGDDDMLQPHLRRRIGQILRLIDIDLARHPRLDVAESAGPRADVAQDHDGRMFLRPAFADIGAGRFLAYRRQPLVPHQLARFMIGGAGRRLDADPVGLAHALRLTGHGDGGNVVHWPQIAMQGRSCQC